MIQFTALRWSITCGAFSLEDEAERLWRNFIQLMQTESSPAPAQTAINPREPV